MFARFLVIFLLWWEVQSFPDGAPIDACVKARANQPNHGQHRTQPLTTSPYRVTASSAVFRPNDVITGKYLALQNNVVKTPGRKPAGVAV